MSFKKGLMASALVIAFGWPVMASAQETQESEGIVRITDGRVGSPIRAAAANSVQQMNGCQTTTTGAPCANGSCQSNVGNGMCQGGSCQAGCYGSGACNSRRCPHGCMGGICCQHCCSHSPDYGYSPPAKYPLNRRGVEYTHYYPANWYGAGADYSQSTAQMVYQPTDTTQLGYTYQHVPFWQPQSNMLPPRPIPAQWNLTPPAVEASIFGKYCAQPGYGTYGAGCRTGHHGGWHTPACRRNYWTGAYTFYQETGTCPPNAVSQPSGSSPTPMVPNPDPGSMGQPTSPTPAPGEASPKPVQDYDSTAPQTNSSGQPNSGTEPSSLPSQLNLVPVPSLQIRTPLPNNSAASNHIRRISDSRSR